MPRSFLVKNRGSKDDGDFCRASQGVVEMTHDDGDMRSSNEEIMEHCEEIDVVGDCEEESLSSSEDKDENSPKHSGDRVVTPKYEGLDLSHSKMGQSSPPEAIAMIQSKRHRSPNSHQRSPEPQKISPSIAPQLLLHSRLKRSPSPGFKQGVTTDSSTGSSIGVNRFSDPKFWQNTLPSITHHYASPFNFHRLPAIIASSQNNGEDSPMISYPHPCFPMSRTTPVPFTTFQAMTAAQSLFRSPADANSLLMTSPTKLDPREHHVPYAFASPTSKGVLSPGLQAPLSVNHLHGREHPDIRRSLYDRDSPLKIKPQASSPVENRNVLQSPDGTGSNKGSTSPIGSTKTLTWLHDLPYSFQKDCEGKDGLGGGHRRPNDPPRYQCEACKKSYATFSGLSKHKQFHCESHVKKEFSCKYCDKTYNSLGALKMHIRTHTLPCKCQICGKAFSRPWLLQGHLRTHTGEKPFVCPQCGRAFADRSNLRAHLQTHSDVKKYSCQECTKTFSRMSLLAKHKEGSCPGIRNSALHTMITASV